MYATTNSIKKDISFFHTLKKIIESKIKVLKVSKPSSLFDKISSPNTLLGISGISGVSSVYGFAKYVGIKPEHLTEVVKKDIVPSLSKYGDWFSSIGSRIIKNPGDISKSVLTQIEKVNPSKDNSWYAWGWSWLGYSQINKKTEKFNKNMAIIAAITLIGISGTLAYLAFKKRNPNYTTKQKELINGFYENLNTLRSTYQSIPDTIKLNNKIEDQVLSAINKLIKNMNMNMNMNLEIRLIFLKDLLNTAIEEKIRNNEKILNKNIQILKKDHNQMAKFSIL